MLRLIPALRWRSIADSSQENSIRLLTLGGARVLNGSIALAKVAVNRTSLKKSEGEARDRSVAAIQARVVDDLQGGHQLIVVTGARGTGKTMLCQLIGMNAGPRTFPYLVRTPALDIDSLLRDLVGRIGVLPAGSQHDGLNHSTLLAV